MVASSQRSKVMLFMGAVLASAAVASAKTCLSTSGDQAFCCKPKNLAASSFTNDVFDMVGCIDLSAADTECEGWPIGVDPDLGFGKSDLCKCGPLVSDASNVYRWTSCPFGQTATCSKLSTGSPDDRTADKCVSDETDAEHEQSKDEIAHAAMLVWAIPVGVISLCCCCCLAGGCAYMYMVSQRTAGGQTGQFFPGQLQQPQNPEGQQQEVQAGAWAVEPSNAQPDQEKGDDVMEASAF